MSPRSNWKTSTCSAVNLKKHLTSLRGKLEPMIWSRVSGQLIPCLDKCQDVCPISKKHTVNQGRVSLLFHYLECGRHVGRLCRRRHAYTPTSNTASHDNHEKINSWVSFCFSYEYGTLPGSPMRRWSSTIIASYVIDYFDKTLFIHSITWVPSKMTATDTTLWDEQKWKKLLSTVDAWHFKKHSKENKDKKWKCRNEFKCHKVKYH